MPQLFQKLPWIRGTSILVIFHYWDEAECIWKRTGFVESKVAQLRDPTINLFTSLPTAARRQFYLLSNYLRT